MRLLPTSSLLAHIALATSSSSSSAAPTALPVVSLVLYENGVGAFTRAHTLPAHASASIPLRAGQLDDALKSLVLRTDGGFASLEYAPPMAAEAARLLAGLPQAPADSDGDGTSDGDLGAWLRALRGVDVVVTEARASASVLRGHVVDVVEEPDGVDREGQPRTTPALLLMGPGGLQRVALRALASVRPVNDALLTSWTRAIASGAQTPSQQPLVVRNGGSRARVEISYATEAPTWRTTHRIFVDEHGARLQAFGLVHNDSDDDWQDVRVQLASGRPSSFVFPLAGPRYATRELVAPDDGLQVAPQLLGDDARTLLLGDSGGSGSGALGVGGLGTRGTGAGGGGYVAHHFGAVVTSSPLVVTDGPTPLPAAAISTAGDQFLYTAQAPVSLHAHHSALVPLLDEKLDVERVTVVAADGAPSLALRIRNSLLVPLHEGTLTVFVDNAYAGETGIDRVRPHEVLVRSHGVDLDVESTLEERVTTGAPRRALLSGLASGATLQLARVDRVTHHVHATSHAARDRVLFVPLQREGFVVVDGAREDERTPGQPRYGRVALPAGGTIDIDVVEEGVVQETIDGTRLHTARLDAWLQGTTSDEVKSVLTTVRAAIACAQQEEARAQALRVDVQQLQDEQARVRASITALGVTAAEASRKLGDRLVEVEAAMTTKNAAIAASEAHARALRTRLST